MTSPARPGVARPSRRALIGGLGGAVVTVGAGAGCSSRGAIVVVAPHPDDEVLRLTGYVLQARDRGDDLVLVAVTDGEASGARPPSWSREHLVSVRTREQDTAWSLLTRGAGSVVRLGLPDGGLAENAVRDALRPVLDAHPGAVVAAASDVDDEHPDHRVVARAVRGLAGAASRTARPPGHPGGKRWDCPDTRAAEAADDSYSPFGHRSVPGLFDDLRAARYASAVVA